MSVPLVTTLPDFGPLRFFLPWEANHNGDSHSYVASQSPSQTPPLKFRTDVAPDDVSAVSSRDPLRLGEGFVILLQSREMLFPPTQAWVEDSFVLCVCVWLVLFCFLVLKFVSLHSLWHFILLLLAWN